MNDRGQNHKFIAIELLSPSSTQKAIGEFGLPGGSTGRQPLREDAQSSLEFPKAIGWERSWRERPPNDHSGARRRGLTSHSPC